MMELQMEARERKAHLPLCLLAAGTILSLCGASAGEVEVINAQTPRRVYVTQCRAVVRAPDGPVLVHGHRKEKFDAGVRSKWSSPFPPADWMGPAFDDQHWGRYQEELFELVGAYGYWRGEWHSHPAPAMIHLRTRFGVSDPARVNDLTLRLTYIGGALVYVNGQEVARGHMPQGTIEPETLAEDYPLDAYTTKDGKTPLPPARHRPADKWLDRYEKRSRTLSVVIPLGVLVKGGNVLAISLHRAAIAGPMANRAWGHVGVLETKLTSASGSGVIPYAEALKGLHAWNANAADTVTERRRDNLDRRSTAGGGVFAHAYPAKGMTVGNPFDPLGTVKMVGARNGSCSGQVVFSDPGGIRSVAAKSGPLAGPGGATIPAAAVQIRYAVQQEGSHYCDALMEAPPERAPTLPVWVIVKIPEGQAPGWYAGTLTVAANEQRFAVAVKVLVSGFELPDPKRYQSLVSLMQSPDTVALHYGVEPWSERHFELLEPSLALLGRVGNDVIYVPIILGTQMGHHTGMIRWTKADEGYKPDFSVFERYLSLYLQHCPPPQAVCLTVWEPTFGRERVVSYADRGNPNARPDTRRKRVKPLRVTVADPQTGKAGEMEPPWFGQEGSEAFWKPMFDGVRASVTTRRLDERTILLAHGFDRRPGRSVVEFFRRVAPYARWVVYSHYDGDPGPRSDGKLVVRGGLELGFAQTVYPQPLPAMYPENAKLQALQCLRAGADRFSIHQESSPNSYRNLTLSSGGICRHGLDFWPVAAPGTRKRQRLLQMRDAWRIWNEVPWALSAPGPQGAVSTVRFQMFREAVQEAEARIAIKQALFRLPAAARKPYLEELRSYPGWVSDYLPQAQLSRDPLGGVAVIYRLAGELTGARTDARWTEPPE